MGLLQQLPLQLRMVMVLPVLGLQTLLLLLLLGLRQGQVGRLQARVLPMGVQQGLQVQPPVGPLQHLPLWAAALPPFKSRVGKSRAGAGEEQSFGARRVSSSDSERSGLRGSSEVPPVSLNTPLAPLTLRFSPLVPIT